MKTIEAKIAAHWPKDALAGQLIKLRDKAGCYVSSRRILLDGRVTPCLGLSHVFVDEDYRHGGVGRLLLEQVFDAYPDQLIVCFIRPYLADFYCGWSILSCASSGKIMIAKNLPCVIGRASLVEGDSLW